MHLKQKSEDCAFHEKERGERERERERERLQEPHIFVLKGIAQKRGTGGARRGGDAKERHNSTNFLSDVSRAIPPCIPLSFLLSVLPAAAASRPRCLAARLSVSLVLLSASCFAVIGLYSATPRRLRLFSLRSKWQKQNGARGRTPLPSPSPQGAAPRTLTTERERERERPLERAQFSSSLCVITQHSLTKLSRPR